MSDLNKRRRSSKRSLLAITLLILSTNPLQANEEFAASNPIITVTTGVDELSPGPGNGFCSLGEAIINANSGSQTYVDCASGSTTSPPQQVDILIDESAGFIDVNIPKRLGRPMRIIGPSPVDKAIIRSQSPTAQSGFFYITDDIGAARIEFRNLRFEGRAKRDSLPGVGEFCRRNGGIICAHLRNPGQRLTIVDSEFVQGSLDFPLDGTNGRNNGGAIAVTGVFNTGSGKPLVTIEGTRFEGNVVMGRGGALFVSEVDLILRDSHFSINDAAIGGGFYAEKSDSLVINQSSFIDNWAIEPASDGVPYDAAAFQVNEMSSILLLNSWIESNDVFEVLAGNFVPNRGRAVNIIGSSSRPGSLLINNSYFGENGAAGLRVRQMQGTIASTTLYSNRLAGKNNQQAAGITFDNSQFEVVNSSIIGNLVPTSSPGVFGVGGIAAKASVLNLEHVTIAENETLSPPRVGGLQLDESSTVNLSGTLLAGNMATVNGNVGVFGNSTLNVHSSQFGDSAAEINGTNTANEFSDVAGVDAIQDMGCSVLAGMSANAACVPLSPLTAGAVALDRSDPATTLTSDQRGLDFNRRFGGGNLPDIGAHELQPPIVSFLEVLSTAFNEGDSGTTPFSFLLQRNGDKRLSSSATWSLLGNGSSPADASDFDPSSWNGGSAIFSPGADLTLIEVLVLGDPNSEPSEGFRLEIDSVTNGRPGDAAQQSGTILNDDGLIPAATISLAPVAINSLEGSNIFGSRQTFRVTRSQVLGGICSFQAELSASGPAGVNSEDFSNWSLGTQTFQMQPGQEFVDIELQVTGDALYEGDEAYRLSLINPSGCFVDITADAVDGLIVDDESLISISPGSLQQAEGTGSTSHYSFEIRRVGYTGDADSVDWQVTGSGPNAASADDFLNAILPAGSAGFPPGFDVVTVNVQVIGDSAPEPDEQFTIELTAPIGGELGMSVATATIINDDVDSDRIFSDRFQ